MWDFRGIADVYCEGLGGSSVGTDRLGYGLVQFCIAVQQKDASAFGSEEAGDGFADSRGGSGNQGSFVVEKHGYLGLKNNKLKLVLPVKRTVNTEIASGPSR